ncbi:competence type IV pilus minor pilin ComGF [Streptococcus ruminantium]|uniref:competence type IV pilus minor pilin ComGF n=1 Tax=Streptococcus ruminantium TaxID=1917441 RepID=UPI0012DE2EDA|nr:competence type IV pilus minor pilin ComGF [Streptococcus ruminantium]
MLKIRTPAFTLLECLVALVVLSGSLLVFEGLSKLISHEVRYQSKVLQKDWLLFSDQLRAEWAQAALVRVESNRIYINKEGQGLAFGKSRSDDFRKTNEKGQGYQPMLYGLQATEIVQEGRLVRMDFTFTNGEERTFIYAFEKTG